MTAFPRTCSKGLAIAGMSLPLLSVLAYAAGARINTARSTPTGMYWTNSMPFTKDAYVMFCPPPADIFDIAKRPGCIAGGFCPGSYGIGR